MSWLFAVCRPGPGPLPVDASSRPTPLRTALSGTLRVEAGGNRDTLFWEDETDTAPGWAVAGIGIIPGDSGYAIMAQGDWSRFLSARIPDVTGRDGHFVILRWKSGRLECFTDQLGLRTLYHAVYDGGICVSTRLDRVARETGHREIDLSPLGERWLLYNQLTYDSGITGIGRLGPGGSAVFHEGRLQQSTAFRPWLPSFEPCAPSGAVERLRGIVRSRSDRGDTPSLGLSGGMDSRVLLALLVESRGTDFTTHTWGDAGDPDVLIARQLAATLGVHHIHFDDPLPDTEACIPALRSYAAQAQLAEPATSYLKLRYYPRLRTTNNLLIDGGFGEIARRRYLNRLAAFGRRALIERDPSRILPFLRHHRADIFSPEAASLLEEGARRGVEEVLHAMPPAAEIGVGNFADLLAVRSRIPNFGASEQARTDGEILNLMPLIQPSFLHAIFGLPETTRSNARLCRNIILGVRTALGSVPLATSGVLHRFGLSSAASWLTVRLKSRLRGSYTDPNPGILLAHLREFMFDTAHSTDVRSYAMYDLPRLETAMTRFHSGDARYMDTVNWWLTFELWRQTLSASPDDG